MEHTYKVKPKLKIKKVVDGQISDKPEDTKEIETHMTGKIVVDVPGHEERIKLIRDTRFEKKDGEIVALDTEEVGFKMNAVAMKLVKKVEVIAKDEDGNEIEIKNVEDLGAFYEGTQVIQDIFSTIVGGIKLGKS